MSHYQHSQLSRIDRAIDALHAERRRLAARTPRVAFQGARGAFSEDAVSEFFGTSAVLRPCRTLADVMRDLETCSADYAVIPVRNTLAGAVPGSADLLRRHDVHVAGERQLRIAHMLIGTSHATLESLRLVRSHPVALAQCQLFLGRHPELRTEAAFDTAGAVADIVHAGDASVGAIGSARAAALYGGAILAENLQDTPDNFTTFVLLAPGRAPARDSPMAC